MFSDSPKIHPCFQIHWACPLKTMRENLALGAHFIVKRHRSLCQDNSIQVTCQSPGFSCQISIVLFRTGLFVFFPTPYCSVTFSISCTNNMWITFFKQEGKRITLAGSRSKVRTMLVFPKWCKKVNCQVLHITNIYETLKNNK